MRHPAPAASPSRTLGGAIALGIASGLWVALVEVGWLAHAARVYFDGLSELARYALHELGLLAGAGAAVGLLLGLIAIAVERIAETLAARRPSERWADRTYTLLCAPPLAWGCAQIFRGPRAREIPGHSLYAFAICALALGALYAGIGLYRALLARVESDPRRPLAAALTLLGATWGLYVADQRILPRLYLFFHVGLDLAIFAAAALGLALLWRIARARRKLRLPPSGVAIACLAALVLFGLALHSLRETRGLRTLALERAAPLARLIELVQKVDPFQPRRLGAQAHRARAAIALPEGPRLGDVDIFLLTIDAMRADRLNPSTAPHLFALAQSGVTFTRAYAQVPHTSFSLATLMTGTYVYSLSTLGIDAAKNETLAQVLTRERYKTAAFYPPAVFYIDGERLRAFEESNYGFEYAKYEYLPAPERTDQVIHFLKSERPPRAFVWVHYFEPHEPYEMHPGYTRSSTGGPPSLEDRYDGEVRLVDAEAARLLDWERQHRRRALVVVAADHGEEFGEHGGRYHGTTLYEEQVRVPLFFALVGNSDGPPLPARRVAGPVGLVDVMPTILSLVGIAPSARLRGRDLSPWMSPAGAPDDALGPIFSEIGRKKMVVDGLDKLICDLETESCQLFDLKSDPMERKNLAGEAARFAPLRAELDDWMAAGARFAEPATAFDPRTQKILDRGRLGDRAALGDLAALLGSQASLEARREAARLIVSLPADPEAASALATAAGSPDRALQRWAEVGQARLGDAAAQRNVAGFLDEACARPDELCAAAALATGDVPHLVIALEHFKDDYDQALPLIAALGASRSPDAAFPLLIQLGEVRTRLKTAQALTALGDPRVLPAIERWIPHEPYLPVRAQLATLLGALGAGDPAARRTLAKLAANEREPEVRRAISAALDRLGSAQRTAPASHAR